MINFINSTCFYRTFMVSIAAIKRWSVFCPKKAIERLSRASLLSVVRPLVEVKGTSYFMNRIHSLCFKTD